MTNIHRIFVPFDFGEAFVHALELAKTIGERFGATLEVLHVVPNPYIADATGPSMPLPPDFLDTLVSDAEEGLAGAISRQDRERFKTRSIVKVGDPRSEILERAGSTK